MLYSCTHMATVDVKGLNRLVQCDWIDVVFDAALAMPYRSDVIACVSSIGSVCCLSADWLVLQGILLDCIYTVTGKKRPPKQNAVKCTIYNTI